MCFCFPLLLGPCGAVLSWKRCWGMCVGRGKLMRRDQEWAAIPAKAFPWQFTIWKMWVLGNLGLFLPIHCSIMEEGNGGGLIAEMFCLSYCPGSSSVVGNINAAAGGWQEWEQMVGSSWLLTICSHCEHLRAAFVELLGPLQLHITTPCISRPPFAPQWQPRFFLWLKVFWVFFGRAFLGSAPGEGYTGAPLPWYEPAWDFSPHFLYDFQGLLGPADAAGRTAHIQQPSSPPGTAISAPVYLWQHPALLDGMLSPSKLGYHQASWSWALLLLASGRTCWASFPFPAWAVGGVFPGWSKPLPQLMASKRLWGGWFSIPHLFGKQLNSNSGKRWGKSRL